MAYMSKVERLCQWLDYRHNEWMRSLAAKSTKELQLDLEYMEDLLAHTPKRHTHRLADRESNVRIVRAVIAKRMQEGK